MRRKGILISDIGSPRSFDVKDVRQFIGQFLSDPDVLDLPGGIRQVLAKGIIARTRAPQSAEKYRAIWTERGSPISTHTADLARELASRTQLKTAVGMRYGSPSIKEALLELAAVDELYVIGLYAQHAGATRMSLIKELARLNVQVPTHLLRPYCKFDDFKEELRSHVKRYLMPDVQTLVTSYHGLPVRQISKADTSRLHCLKTPDCCESPNAAHATCYRQNCVETTQCIREGVEIPVQLSFQSRVGPAKWLSPSTTDVITDAARSGLKVLAVTCPSFATDNLETLYDIALQERESFIEAGGQRLDLIPALNCEPIWINLLADWIQEPAQRFDLLPRS